MLPILLILVVLSVFLVTVSLVTLGIVHLIRNKFKKR